MKNIVACAFALLLFALPLGAEAADILVQDLLAVAGEDAQRVAETKGRYFSAGGVQVEFRVEERPAGRTMSGGDGVARQAFRFRKPGVYTITARAAGKTAQSTAAVVRKGSRIICVDVEGTLFSRPFAGSSIQEARGVIRNMKQKAQVVYLHTGTIGKEVIRKWLTKNRFPEAPVVDWDAGEVFGSLKTRGISLKAVIASPAVLDTVAPEKPQTFSFEDSEGSVTVRSWKEIEKRLK